MLKANHVHFVGWFVIDRTAYGQHM